MQCDDCREVYLADNERQLCPRCGGKGTVLVDITREFYPNRAARRKARNEKVEKYLPCPLCSKSSLDGKEHQECIDREAVIADLIP